MTNNPILTKADLAQFTGTEHWYRHTLNRSILYTDGVQYMAETGGAYWLVDTIALMQLEKHIAAQDFQLWILSVLPDRSALLVCQDGNDNTVHKKVIVFTDFPLDEIKLYVTGGVILLPSEY